MSQFLKPETVQAFLDQLAPMQPFSITFQTISGERRDYVGTLDPNATNKKENVVFMTPDFWKSFNVSRVVTIEPTN